MRYGDSWTHQAQKDVAEFHRALDIPVGTIGQPYIDPGRKQLRADLIREEAGEAIGAIMAEDLIETIDGLVDLLVVTYGAAVEFGVDLAPFWDEVHESNMAKQGGPTRDDGKKLKPDGWQPPDISGVLKRTTTVPDENEFTPA